MSKFIFDRLTKCDSGFRLNPLMHVFIFITLMFSLVFLFPGVIAGVAASPLFLETAQIGSTALNLWGAVGLLTVILHFAGFLLRGRWGTQLIQFAAAGGFFTWLWAAIIYINGGFIFQLLVGALPNVLFWVWYAWQWRRRHHNKRVAFV